MWNIYSHAAVCQTEFSTIWEKAGPMSSPLVLWKCDTAGRKRWAVPPSTERKPVSVAGHGLVLTILPRSCLTHPRSGDSLTQTLPDRHPSTFTLLEIWASVMSEWKHRFWAPETNPWCAQQPSTDVGKGSSVTRLHCLTLRAIPNMSMRKVHLRDTQVPSKQRPPKACKRKHTHMWGKFFANKYNCEEQIKNHGNLESMQPTMDKRWKSDWNEVNATPYERGQS